MFGSSALFWSDWEDGRDASSPLYVGETALAFGALRKVTCFSVHIALQVHLKSRGSDPPVRGDGYVGARWGFQVAPRA